MPDLLKISRTGVALFWALASAGTVLNASATGQVDRKQRPITVEDCVTTRRVVDQEVQISPDGTRVAYVVKAPDVRTNRNAYEIYIRPLDREMRGNGHLLFRGSDVSSLRWVGSSELIARVKSHSGVSLRSKVAIVVLNVSSGSIRELPLPKDINHFGASADGRTLVFSRPARRRSAEAQTHEKTILASRGYPIRFGEGAAGSIEDLPEDELYVARKEPTGRYDVRRITFRDFEGLSEQTALRNVLRIDLSPDGNYLLLVFSAAKLPAGWERQPYIEASRRFGTRFETYVLGLCDLKSGRLRLGFDFAGALLHTRWADDSSAYSVVGPSPFGNEASNAEQKAAVAAGNPVHYMLRFQHVFTADVQTGKVNRVLSREAGQTGNLDFLQDVPFSWKQGRGPMLVRTTAYGFAWMIFERDAWEKRTEFTLKANECFLSSLSSNGETVVGVLQGWTIPPDVFSVDLRTDLLQVLTDLNPQYRNITLGQVERLLWTNRYGSRCAGLIVKPVGYRTGTRYPIVFLAAPVTDVFISDAAYTTSYAPQPLANAGFVVVISQYPLENKVPRNAYPGQISEAYNWMAMVESAIELLVEQGIAEKDNVAIAGFSRTSWLTDFTLTHSSYNFVAASSADSAIYTYGAYFQDNSAQEMKGAEAEIGGPPYGEAFKHWLSYCPPFLAASVNAALLMEYTGTDGAGFEFFTALARLGKLVEYFRYPQGAHPLDTPFERVASLHRNVDWFRFWMQGYEGTPPEYDSTQYLRWRDLKKQQQWIQEIRSEGKDPVAEFLSQTEPNHASNAEELAPRASSMR